MWAEVIFHSVYLYLHNSTYPDNNCQAYGKIQKYIDSKHKHVLIGKAHSFFVKHIFVLQNSFVFSIYGACFSNKILEGEGH